MVSRTALVYPLRNGFEELYDTKDPHEFVNLAKEPKLAKVREGSPGVHADAAKIAFVPKDSPHHRGRNRSPKASSLPACRSVQHGGAGSRRHGSSQVLQRRKGHAPARHEERIRPQALCSFEGRKGKLGHRKDAFIRFRNKQGVMAGGVSIGFTGYGSMKSRHHIGPELGSVTASVTT